MFSSQRYDGYLPLAGAAAMIINDTKTPQFIGELHLFVICRSNWLFQCDILLLHRVLFVSNFDSVDNVCWLMNGRHVACSIHFKKIIAPFAKDYSCIKVGSNNHYVTSLISCLFVCSIRARLHMSSTILSGKCLTSRPIFAS